MATPFYNYANIVAKSTPYAKRMQRLSKSIFGKNLRPETYRSKRVIVEYSVMPHELNPDIVDRYPRHVETGKLMEKLREFGLYRYVLFGFHFSRLNDAKPDDFGQILFGNLSQNQHYCCESGFKISCICTLLWCA